MTAARRPRGGGDAGDRAWWRSFQARSVLASLAASVLVWAAWALWSWSEANDERSRRYDLELKVNAEIMLRAFPPALLAQQAPSVFDVTEPVERWTAAYAFNYQVWSADRRLIARAGTTPAQPLNPSFAPGFSDARIDGALWRVYSVVDRAGRVQVQTGMGIEQRRALALMEASEALAGLGVVLVPLSLCLLWVGHWTARPLRTLRDAVARRPIDDDSPLPVTGLPSEAVPLVRSFNEVLRRATQAREAQRRFVGDAAHELRTPLAALRVQAQVALRARDDAQRQAALGRLLEGIDRTTHVAEQLLDLAQADGMRADASAVRVRPVNVAALLAETARACLALAERRGVRLEVGPPPRADALYVVGHPELLATALRNVADNAVRYSPPGSTVRVEGVRDGAEVRVTVTDNGTGLTAAQRERAMVPFVRLQPQADETGSGLGLSIVQRICALLEVQFELREAPGGRGLQARFAMRAAPPAPGDLRAIPAPMPPIG